MTRIKIQSLNISFEEFIFLIYHQTGKQFKYDFEASNIMDAKSVMKEVFEFIRPYHIEVEEIFEPVKNFKPSLFTKEKHWIKHSTNKSLNWLRIFRDKELKLDYRYHKEEDLVKLR